jgi:hypothetical protein
MGNYAGDWNREHDSWNAGLNIHGVQTSQSWHDMKYI